MFAQYCLCVVYRYNNVNHSLYCKMCMYVQLQMLFQWTLVCVDFVDIVVVCLCVCVCVCVCRLQEMVN